MPAPDFLCQLAARIEDVPAGLIGGQTLNALSGNPYSSMSQQIVDLVYAPTNAAATATMRTTTTTCCPRP